MKNTFANMAVFFVMLMLVISCSTGGFDELENELIIDGLETEGPEVEGPETEKPKTEGPEVKEPETEGPETEKPGTGGPETEKPGVNEPKKNDRVPELLINELRTLNSNVRSEFIEFKMRSEGNLDGLRVFVASNGNESMIYEFPPEEVKAEEYVVLYLRTLDNNQDISQNAYNFQIPGSDRKLLQKTDAVYVQDQDDKVLCAVMISESSNDSAWKKANLDKVAEFLFEQNAWKSLDGKTCGGPADAVSSADIGTAVTKSISRDETAANTNTAADWFVTGTMNNGATPGQSNNPRP